MTGVDLSAPMLGTLENGGGRARSPVVQGDVLLLPFADDASGGASVGPDPREPDARDAAFVRHPAALRLPGSIPTRDDTTVGGFLDETSDGQHSWTWRVPAEVRERIIPALLRIVRRVYDFPS